MPNGRRSNGQDIIEYQHFAPAPDSWSVARLNVVDDSPELDFNDDDELNASYDDDDDSPRNNYVRPSELPLFELPNWSMGDRDNAVRLWSAQIVYRLRWIFQREEREGVNRSRYTSPFSPADFKQRVEKSSHVHSMNTETSTFYDWKLGDSDFLMRLEAFEIDDQKCLRCHFIHKSTGKELCYQDRLWNGNYYDEVNMVWANS